MNNREEMLQAILHRLRFGRYKISETKKAILDELRFQGPCMISELLSDRWEKSKYRGHHKYFRLDMRYWSYRQDYKQYYDALRYLQKKKLVARRRFSNSNQWVWFAKSGGSFSCYDCKTKTVLLKYFKMCGTTLPLCKTCLWTRDYDNPQWSSNSTIDDTHYESVFNNKRYTL